jgi:hypothetical protein
MYSLLIISNPHITAGCFLQKCFCDVVSFPESTIKKLQFPRQRGFFETGKRSTFMWSYFSICSDASAASFGSAISSAIL